MQAIRRPRQLGRTFDRLVGATLGLVGGPACALGAMAVLIEDGRPVLYRAERVGLDRRPITVYKLRTMRVGAASSGVDTTAAGDPRLLRVGPLLRRLKLDEIPQFLNLLDGSMAVIGPRPNVPREVAKYTEPEKRLLEVRPGLTDVASVALADLGALIAGTADANRAYECDIRPSKSALSKFHIDHRGLALDLVVLALTAAAVVAPRRAARWLGRWLRRRHPGDVTDPLDRIEALRSTSEPANP